MALYSTNHIIRWVGGAVTRPSLEAVVGSDNFQQPWFLRKGLRISAAICLLPKTKGTGFLIGPSLIMTNWHVIRTEAWASGQVALFDFEQDEDGTPTETERCNLRPDLFFHSSESLDYAVVGVEPSKTMRSPIDISAPGLVALDSRVNIIQHPGAGLKRIAIRDNGIKFLDSTTVQYWTDTEHGSSGSPLFDDDWNIIGVHYKHDVAAGDIIYNEGHRIEAILDDLQAARPGVMDLLHS